MIRPGRTTDEASSVILRWCVAVVVFWVVFVFVLFVCF